MKQLILCSVICIFCGHAEAQVKLSKNIRGTYHIEYMPLPEIPVDTMNNGEELVVYLPILRGIQFNGTDVLRLKWNRRFTLKNSLPINDLGLNTDHPTIYGAYTLRNGELILYYRYSIQHFNKLAQKGRVKIKRMEVKSFKRVDSVRFKIGEYQNWQIKK